MNEMQIASLIAFAVILFILIAIAIIIGCGIRRLCKRAIRLPAPTTGEWPEPAPQEPEPQEPRLGKLPPQALPQRKRMMYISPRQRGPVRWRHEV